MAPAAAHFQGFTTSIRTGHGRLFVHVDKGALCKLGASRADDSTQLRTLQRHMPRLRALALQLAALNAAHEVSIGETDVWWSGNKDGHPS